MFATVQLLGRLYRQMPAKRQTAVQQFQEAARNNVGSSSVWQMLGELLAQSNVHGAARANLALRLLLQSLNTLQEKT